MEQSPEQQEESLLFQLFLPDLLTLLTQRRDDLLQTQNELAHLRTEVESRGMSLVDAGEIQMKAGKAHGFLISGPNGVTIGYARFPERPARWQVYGVSPRRAG